MQPANENPGILISCYYQKSVRGENLIYRHALAWQIAGSLVVKDGRETVRFYPGDLRFNVRNKVAKFAKLPDGDVPFRSLSLQFDDAVLREFAASHNFRSEKKVQTTPSFQLGKHPLLLGFMQSLALTLPHIPLGNSALTRLKLTEALLILLEVQSDLQHILFDFDDPGKINLQAFMEQHFRYNLSIERLAYLSGRSISGFKRDFAKTYGMTPARWIQERRLEEAFYLLKEKKLRTTDACLEAGFENLSHFSFIFKKRFGCAPSVIARTA